MGLVLSCTRSNDLLCRVLECVQKFQATPFGGDLGMLEAKLDVLSRIRLSWYSSTSMVVAFGNWSASVC